MISSHGIHWYGAYITLSMCILPKCNISRGRVRLICCDTFHVHQWSADWIHAIQKQIIYRLCQNDLVVLVQIKQLHFHGDIIIFAIYTKTTSPTKMWMHCVKSKSSSWGPSCWIGCPLLDFSKAFDKVPHTHMLIFIQPRPMDPVQYLSTDMYPAQTFLHISRSTKYYQQYYY